VDSVHITKPTHQSGGLRKVIRFISIYGPGRTWFKAAARLRLPVPSWKLASRTRDIGLIGCGQFAFATIGYFLQRRFGPRLAACFDVDEKACHSLARALRVPLAASDIEALLAAPGLRTVYIASNHASHAGYAVTALQRGLDVYVEKPVAVTREQLDELTAAQSSARGRLFAGYNRPFSAAVQAMREAMPIVSDNAFSMQCFVAGHRIAPTHWYRRPEEGTRICGNVGHWLDLFVHILGWRGWPSQLRVSLQWADAREPDDNLVVVLASERGDLCSIMLTSRNEPFEGIQEAIAIQHGEVTCRIDDFRRMTMWRGEQLRRWRFWPKDVGHERAIMQPFASTPPRPWAEIETSSLLMLQISDMVRDRRDADVFRFPATPSPSAAPPA
jgi:predicted dehydrogenase